MGQSPANKHETRSAQTRELFIQAAQELYAERSIDAVSLNEITVAAGQKNRNALQYHFGSRDGLLQAIIDKHAEAVHELRCAVMEQAHKSDWSAAEASARVLVMPLTEYIVDNPEGIHYVKILSQLAAINSEILNPTNSSELSFRREPELGKLLTKAVSHLHPVEAQRRLFLIVSITFHSIADIVRAAATGTENSIFQDRAQMFEQVVNAIESLLSAPAREKQHN
jgi:AcrR family transcriptional regulator